jgi:hypothetical protein
MTATKLSANEWHAAAKRDEARLSRERDSVTARWKEAVLGDDIRGVERYEAEHAELERKLKRVRVLIDGLPAVPQREAQAQKTFPTCRSEALVAFANAQAELERCETILPVNRSAAHQTKIDSLRQRSYAILRFLENHKEDAA